MDYLQDLKDAKLQRFLLDGPNEFRQKDWIARIAESREIPLRGGILRIDVNKTNSRDVFQQMMELDMLIPDRIVVLEKLDTMIDKTRFYQYFEAAPGIIVGTFQIPVDDSNSSFLKRLRAEAHVLDSNNLNLTETGEWLRHHAEFKGLKLQQNQLQLIVDLMGDDLFALDSAVEKLRVASKSEELTNQYIRRALNYKSKENAREIAENILQGRPASVLQALDRYKAGRSAHNFMLYIEEALFRVISIREYADRRENLALVREELELKSDKQYQWLQEISTPTEKLVTMYKALLPFLREDYYSGWERVEQYVYESFI